MKEKFKLSFLSDGIGTVDIDEPFGFNTVSFDFMQKQKGMGRDISFNSGEVNLEFGHTRNHYLPELLYYFNYFGYEAKVQLIIEIDGLDNIIGDLDFAKADTDNLEYFRCKVIQKSELQIIKRRSKVKVDLLSDKDLDGSPIAPLVPTNILVKAKAVNQESKWLRTLQTNAEYVSYGLDEAYATLVNEINLSEIENTLLSTSQFDKYGLIPGEVTNFDIFEPMAIVNSRYKLSGIEVKINNVSLSVMDTSGFYTRKKLQIVYSDTFANGTVKYITLEDTTSDLIINGKNYAVSIPNVNANTKICVYVTAMTAYSIRASTPIGSTSFEIKTGLSLEMSVLSTAYNSITKAFRLVDVMRQVIKSYSGLEIYAPYFQSGGLFYENFILNGNLLRSLTNKPFTISLDEISNSLTEMNADYEVNDRVFFGIEKEFYTNIECGFFDNTQFSTFSKKFNENYSVNTFTYKYNKYQALKENEQPNSSDTIHGETQMLLANKMVENTKPVTVEWIRDSFLVDEARKKSVEITTGTSYQNDTDLFALDCVPNATDLAYIETSELNHEWNAEINRLVLRSNETLNFNVIGLFINTSFEIKNPDLNAGFYTVEKVLAQEIQLKWVSGAIMNANKNGVRFTEYVYTIPKEEVAYVSRTNEGVTTTTNVRSPETFANLMYSVKSNILKYYNSYLATCNLYNKEKAITTTSYLHNGEAIIVAYGETIKENQSIIPTNPILSPYMYENMVYCNVDIVDFINLQKELRSKRGYVRSIDKNGNPIKVYPTKMTYKNLEKELTIVAEEKYEPVVMTLETSAMFTTINGETKVSHLEPRIENNLLSVFDRGGYRLYSPVFWYNVSINGSLSETINILEDRLKLIK
jgi:hypothetical protein